MKFNVVPSKTMKFSVQLWRRYTIESFIHYQEDFANPSQEGETSFWIFFFRKSLPILVKEGKNVFFFGYIFIGRTLIDTVYKNIDIFGVVKIANCSKSLDRKWWWIFAFRCCRLTAEANYTNLEGSKIMCMRTLFFIFASSGNSTTDKALAYEARSCDGNAELISEMIFKALIGSNGGIWCRRV